MTISTGEVICYAHPGQIHKRFFCRELGCKVECCELYRDKHNPKCSGKFRLQTHYPIAVYMATKELRESKEIPAQ